MTTIWLVRHAETAAPTMFHGAESDVALGEHGKRQTTAAAGWFAELRPTAMSLRSRKPLLDPKAKTEVKKVAM